MSFPLHLWPFSSWVEASVVLLLVEVMGEEVEDLVPERRSLLAVAVVAAIVVTTKTITPR